jgi:hypothetical protein
MLDPLPDEDECPPICAACGVTMVPAELSAHDAAGARWVCAECEEAVGWPVVQPL